MAKDENQVVIVGAGLMGTGIAAGFIAHGVDTVLLSRDEDVAGAARRRTMVLAENLGSGNSDGALSTATIDSFSAWSGVGLVIESIKEDLALKRSLFSCLDARVPAGVPIGSNSSSYPISRIAEGLATRSRMFGTHYFMPAHLVPLVEVVLGADSDPVLARRVCDRFAAIGKKPVLVKRDIAGFLANRIQHALMREVLSLIDSGIASPEDIDVAVRYNFGFRYAAIGPVLQKEISGWDSTTEAARAIYPTLSNTTEVPECLQRLVAEGRLGMKAGAGFFPWPAARAAAVRAAYDERLAAALRLLD
ncbi:MAG: 3-hydroxyacyl-CoA dehydrogenase NAD-binding domain-containing protein [Pseudomonadota bacterium]|nr:3-hydroxyacyl-CoA dehydrogenase NAD-binding domain-containing protein [Pseudomonadota bacterium]